jgi:hypothetical protein
MITMKAEVEREMRIERYIYSVSVFEKNDKM